MITIPKAERFLKKIAPRERPILFSGAMVRAIIAGRKTVTRRVVKPQPDGWLGGFGATDATGAPVERFPVRHRARDAEIVEITCPYGAPGSKLWVRETHALVCTVEDVECHCTDDTKHRVEYRADTGNAHPGDWPHGEDGAPKWKPSIFMRREHSRLSLEITAVRVERLHDISDEDVAAEGITAEVCVDLVRTVPGSVKALRSVSMTAIETSARERWRVVWTLINGAESYAANPWVFAISFRRAP